jgi:hypothetical protein
MAPSENGFAAPTWNKEYVWNRAYGPQDFFHTAGDYATFERMLIAAQGRGEGDADLLRDVYSLAPGLMGGLPLTHTQR